LTDTRFKLILPVALSTEIELSSVELNTPPIVVVVAIFVDVSKADIPLSTISPAAEIESRLPGTKVVGVFA
jgi:hypothetical protein